MAIEEKSGKSANHGGNVRWSLETPSCHPSIDYIPEIYIYRLCFVCIGVCSCIDFSCYGRVNMFPFLLFIALFIVKIRKFIEFLPVYSPIPSCLPTLPEL